MWKLKWGLVRWQVLGKGALRNQGRLVLPWVGRRGPTCPEAHERTKWFLLLLLPLLVHPSFVRPKNLNFTNPETKPSGFAISQLFGPLCPSLAICKMGPRLSKLPGCWQGCEMVFAKHFGSLGTLQKLTEWGVLVVSSR